MLPDPRGRAAIVLAVLALACGGCDFWAERKDEAKPAATTTAASEAVKPVAPPVVPEPSAAPLPPASAASLAGLWRVVAVDGGGEAGIAGALMEISPQQLQWSYKPATDFPGGEEICGDPWIGPIEGSAGDAILHARFAAALTRMDAGAKLDHSPYEIDCRASGRWGPGKVGTAHLYRLGADDMLMSWYDDRIVRLRLVRRPGKEAKPELLPLTADDARN